MMEPHCDADSRHCTVVAEEVGPHTPQEMVTGCQHQVPPTTDSDHNEQGPWMMSVQETGPPSLQQLV